MIRRHFLKALGAVLGLAAVPATTGAGPAAPRTAHIPSPGVPAWFRPGRRVALKGCRTPSGAIVYRGEAGTLKEMPPYYGPSGYLYFEFDSGGATFILPNDCYPIPENCRWTFPRGSNPAPS